MVQTRAESITKVNKGCLGFWRVYSPAACQDVHGPDEGGVDHVQDEGGEWDLASRHGTQSHPHHQRPEGGGGATIDERIYWTDTVV